jgi:hypothetical protein
MKVALAGIVVASVLLAACSGPPALPPTNQQACGRWEGVHLELDPAKFDLATAKAGFTAVADIATGPLKTQMTLAVQGLTYLDGADRQSFIREIQSMLKVQDQCATEGRAITYGGNLGQR